MGSEFLVASAKASRGLALARDRHARARHRADDRLAAAQAIHADEVAAAAGIEAEAWRQLMAVPGMTIATAAQIGDVSTRAVHSWLSTGPKRRSDASCT